MTVRAPLRFAAQALPSPAPITRWEHFWDFLDSNRAAYGKPLVPRPTGHNPTMRAYARVDEGRWIADCPWGCGAAFNLPAGADSMWCTECAGGGWGHTAALMWPKSMDKLTANLESLPAMLQFWPCTSCRGRLADGKRLCDTCRGMQGEAV
ncbi:hypothetical protein [Thermoactinospora rubra]|uniref:hypothetical protein n=1 Tax=Thermoactinospora rubra TaxID=1088767 RepID=UPI000A0F57B0|nr:hypothetical protein [Thermoactinospora rubra]